MTEEKQNITKKQKKLEKVVKASLQTPFDINIIVSDIITMMGVLSVDIFDWKGNILYSYYRWGKTETILEEKELFELVTLIKKKMKKIEQNNIKQIVLRSEEINILIFSSESIVLVIHCDQKAKLPLLTILSRRASEQISELM